MVKEQGVLSYHMYLAVITRAGSRRYEIRQSLPDKKHGSYHYRVLFDLGHDPGRYINHPTDDICYFSAKLEDSLAAYSKRDPTSLLEELLWDFLPREEKHRLERFRYRGRARVSPLSGQERAAIEDEVHLFDRRRLYYLRYGAVDQSRIFGLNVKLYRPLLNKCRDEREYYFMDMEKVLHYNELKTYVFAIFDLQRHFGESISATMPEALNQNDIADYFIEDICRLNGDPLFWSKQPGETSLHHHLIRYVIMFFDHGYGRRSLFDDFVREFMGRHRAFQWPQKKPDISSSDAARIFDTDWQALSQMNKKELTRLYRQRAKELHPDGGGEHEQFVELNTAYVSLMIRKK